MSQKIKTSIKKPVIKKKTVLSKESEKKWKQNAWKRSEKNFHHWGFYAKKYTWYENIKRK